MTSHIGVIVKFCGHNGVFIADLFHIKGVIVVNAGGPVTMDNLTRDQSLGPAEYHLLDFPISGFWKPNKGVFVVPASQVKRIKD